jgi:hypothetical protein
MVMSRRRRAGREREIDRRSLSRQGDPGGNEAAVTPRIFLVVVLSRIALASRFSNVGLFSGIDVTRVLSDQVH